MKRIATLTQGGRIVGLVHGPDATNQIIKIRGREWRFDFDDWGGPLWLKKDGEPRKNQCPTIKAVWDAFEKWHRGYRRLKAVRCKNRGVVA